MEYINVIISDKVIYHWTINGTEACQRSGKKDVELIKKDIYVRCTGTKEDVEKYMRIWKKHYPEDTVELCEGQCPRYYE